MIAYFRRFSENYRNIATFLVYSLPLFINVRYWVWQKWIGIFFFTNSSSHPISVQMQLQNGSNAKGETWTRSLSVTANHSGECRKTWKRVFLFADKFVQKKNLFVLLRILTGSPEKGNLSGIGVRKNGCVHSFVTLSTQKDVLSLRRLTNGHIMLWVKKLPVDWCLQEVARHWWILTLQLVANRSWVTKGSRFTVRSSQTGSLN
jgi:hypothetical protein